MRNFVLLLILAMPPLVACGAAHAKASADIGKPICSHYDDAIKAPAARAPSDAQADAAAPAAASPAATPAVAGTPVVAGKGGGTSSMTHTRAAPRWQTFLPGMFR